MYCLQKFAIKIISCYKILFCFFHAQIIFLRNNDNLIKIHFHMKKQTNIICDIFYKVHIKIPAKFVRNSRN